jgi:hypothetical protein
MRTASQEKNADVAIACSVGGFKGVFLHGVLSAFEEMGFRAGAYAAASSSVVPAAAAAIGTTRDLGFNHWREGLRIINAGGQGMSGLALEGIERATPLIVDRLFRAESPRFLIATNIVDVEGENETQGRSARRLGRLLLLSAARGDRSWIDRHLTLQLFDSKSTGENPALSADNFKEVAYASSRMLHAWDIPAWVGERAYVDAFYHCACPAIEAAALGYSKVIAISNEPVLYKDIFQIEAIQPSYNGTSIQIIRPSYDPVEHGVNYTTATFDGLERVFYHGADMGHSFLSAASNDEPSAEL